MLTCIKKAVRWSAASLILAVFFSGQANAVDSSLYSLENGLSRLVYDASRSIVTIEAGRGMVTATAGDTERFRTLVSTGLLVDSGMYVLASASMVAGYATFQIVFENRRLPAKLVGIDYFHEIALLRLSASLGSSVRMCSEQSCAGRMVLALGDSYGVRAAPSLGFCAGARRDGSLQFTMALTSGTTGGGVFNLSGELIGMVSGAIGTDNQVIVAHPAHRLPDIIKYLKTHGDRLAGYIGITTQDIEITPALNVPARANSLVSVSSRSVSQGTMVVSVRPESPASRAGLRAGDILYAVDDDPVGSSLELSTYVRLQQPQKLLRFDVIRRGVRLSVPITVSSKPLSQSVRENGRSRFSAGGIEPDSLARVVEFLMEKINRLERQISASR